MSRVFSRNKSVPYPLQCALHRGAKYGTLKRTMGRSLKSFLIKTALIAFAVLWVLSYFFYVDFEESCFITFKPGVLSLIEFNHGNIEKGLRALKYNKPEVYADICTHVDVITSDFSCGGWQGGCHYGKQGTIILSTTRNEFVGWTAAVIAHEFCHDTQLREGRTFDENECYEFDHEVLQSIVEIYP